jgi:hypothetical protein
MLSSAARHAHRIRRSTGRIVLSAAGFSAAYFLDPENGAARRRRVQDFVRHTGATLDEVISQPDTPRSVPGERESSLRAVPYAASAGIDARIH